MLLACRVLGAPGVGLTNTGLVVRDVLRGLVRIGDPSPIGDGDPSPCIFVRLYHSITHLTPV